MVQLSHPCMTARKTIALIIRTFVGKVMFLLFNMLSRLVIAFLPRSKCLLSLWLQSPSVVILEPKKTKRTEYMRKFIIASSQQAIQIVGSIGHSMLLTEHWKNSRMTLNLTEWCCLKIHRPSFYLGFPGGSEVKASACNTGDLGSIPGSGRSPGEGYSNPLQYSCLVNPMDGGAWWATVHGVTKSQTWLSDFSFTFTFLSTWETYSQR